MLGGAVCLSGRITQTHGNVFLTHNTLSEVDYNARIMLNKAETELTGNRERERFGGGGGFEDNVYLSKLLAVTMMHFICLMLIDSYVV